MNTKEKNRISLASLCPLRLSVLLLSLAWLLFYFLRRGDRVCMNRITDALVRPWHRFAGTLYDKLPFSVAEVYITIGVLLGIAFLVQLVVHFVKRAGDWGGFYRWAVTLLSLLAALFGLFSLWWGVYYYADSFSEKSGIAAKPISVEELENVTRYFIRLANAFGEDVPRDAEGCYAPDVDAIFDCSASVYQHAVAEFPCLAGPELHAKKVSCSVVMSYLNNTGFFFPFTAEANLNVHMPPAMLPSTIAHELAHQRGVAAEDEANFVAVFASMESGDTDYRYSAALMAYIYLGNALFKADSEAFSEAYALLSDSVRLDLAQHNAYWKQFETPVKEVSDKVYTGFLKTYGDDRGLRSYGACVDLLVAYYKDKASE